MLPGDLPILFPPSFGVSLWSFFAPCWGSQSPSKRKSAKKPEVSSVKTHGDHLCFFQGFATWFLGIKPGSWTAARIKHPNLDSPFIELVMPFWPSGFVGTVDKCFNWVRKNLWLPKLVVHTGNPRYLLSPRCVNKNICWIYPPPPKNSHHEEYYIFEIPKLNLNLPLFLGRSARYFRCHEMNMTWIDWIRYPQKNPQQGSDPKKTCPSKRLVGRPMSRNEENAGPSVPGFLSGWQLLGISHEKRLRGGVLRPCDIINNLLFVD